MKKIIISCMMVICLSVQSSYATLPVWLQMGCLDTGGFLGTLETGPFCIVGAMCASALVLGIQKQPPTGSQYGSLVNFNNIKNPYDIYGQDHNALLDQWYVSNIQYSEQNIAQFGLADAPKVGISTSGMTTEPLINVMNLVQKLNITTPSSILGLYNLSDPNLTNAVTAFYNNIYSVSDINTFNSQIVNFENSVVSNSSYNQNDKNRVLQSLSILRQSANYWSAVLKG